MKNYNYNIESSFIEKHGMKIIYAMIISAIIGFLIAAKFEFSHNNPLTATIAFIAAIVLIMSCVWVKIQCRKSNNQTLIGA